MLRRLRRFDSADLIDVPLHYLQRAKRGYSNADTVSFDSHLARVIRGGVRELRERAIGHPPELEMEDWLTILREIEEGFAVYDEAGGWPVGEPEDEVKVKRALKLFKKWFAHLWD